MAMVSYMGLHVQVLNPIGNAIYIVMGVVVSFEGNL